MRKRRIIPVDEAWRRKAVHDLFEVKRQLRTARGEDVCWHLSMLADTCLMSLTQQAQLGVNVFGFILVGDEVRA